MFKKICATSILALMFFSCMNTTTETTVKQDGSGTVVTLIDMSAMIQMLKTFGMEDSLQQMGLDNKMDSTIHFKNLIDEVERQRGSSLSTEEKQVYDNSTFNLKTNFTEGVMQMKIFSSFTNLNQLNIINKLNEEAMNMSSFSTNNQENNKPEIPSSITKAMTSMKLHASDGLIENVYVPKDTNNSEPENTEEAQMLQQMNMFAPEMPVLITYNLPRAAKNVTAKGVTKISADKKTVTITYNLAEVFNDPAVQSYKIEY